MQIVDAVVHPAHHAVEFQSGVRGILEVLLRSRGARQVGQRIVGHGADGYLVHALFGNLIPRKWIANVCGSTGPRRGRVVNGERPALQITGLREIAIALEQRGYDRPSVTGAANLRALVVYEVKRAIVAIEQLWQPHRAAQRTAVGIAFALAFLGAVAVVEEAVGIQVVVAQEPIGRSMELIGSAAGRYVDERGAGMAVLGVVGVGLHAHLLHRIGRGAEADDVDLHVRHAVQQELRLRRGSARAEARHSVVVVRVDGRVATGVLDARRERQKHVRVAADQRQLGHYLRGDGRADAAGLGSQQWRLRCYLNRLLQFAHRHREIHGCRLSGFELDGFTHYLLEPGMFHLQAIGPIVQQREPVHARRARGVRADGAGADVDQTHGRARDGGARAVLNHSGEVTLVHLGRCKADANGGHEEPVE